MSDCRTWPCATWALRHLRHGSASMVSGQAFGEIQSEVSLRVRPTVTVVISSVDSIWLGLHSLVRELLCQGDHFGTLDRVNADEYF